MPRKKYFGFKSGFADNLNSFIEYKENLGFDKISFFLLNNFDEFCFKEYPYENTLTSEIVIDWCGNSEKGIINRCTQIREFAKYLQFIGKEAYIYPSSRIPRRVDDIPYIFSDDEQKKFFYAVDHYPTSLKSPLMEYTAPVIFRVMLLCGTRPLEVLKLKRIDFDFKNETIFFEDSKNHRDRRLAVSHELMNLCQKYDSIAENMFPGRIYFFPNKFGKELSYPSLNYLFQNVWNLSNNDSKRGRPSLYAFRFTFATETLMRWVEEEKDLSVMLPYLSAYMGHVKFKDTYYYIKLLPERISKMYYMNVDSIIPEVYFDEEE